MIFVNEIGIESRKDAAHLLSDKLMVYKNTDAVVVAIPFGGVPLGFWLAKRLNLTFNVMPCRMLRLPGKGFKTIGSISVDEVYINEETEGMEDLPQSYAYHQIKILKNSVDKEFNIYSSIKPPETLQDRTVIVVDDVLIHSDAVMASLRSIRKQTPANIVMATSFISEEAAFTIADTVDDLIYLYKDRNVQRIRNVASCFSKVKQEDVRKFLLKSLVHKDS